MGTVTSGERHSPRRSSNLEGMATEETVTLGGGCFWCVEAVYQEMEGVIAVESGYMGGRLANPTYQQVCSGATGHVEVVQVKFDPRSEEHTSELQSLRHLV